MCIGFIPIQFFHSLTPLPPSLILSYLLSSPSFCPSLSFCVRLSVSRSVFVFVHVMVGANNPSRRPEPSRNNRDAAPDIHNEHAEPREIFEIPRASNRAPDGVGAVPACLVPPSALFSLRDVRAGTDPRTGLVPRTRTTCTGASASAARAEGKGGGEGGRYVCRSDSDRRTRGAPSGFCRTCCPNCLSTQAGWAGGPRPAWGLPGPHWQNRPGIPHHDQVRSGTLAGRPGPSKPGPSDSPAGTAARPAMAARPGLSAAAAESARDQGVSNQLEISIPPGQPAQAQRVSSRVRI